jgi:hypothetical protein
VSLYPLRRAHGRLRWFLDARRVEIPDQPGDHLPDFLVIGAPRSGTTWMLRNLARHQDVFMFPREIHFLDRHYQRGWDWYAGHFVEGTGRVRGEKTPAYAHQPQERIDAVFEHLPRARLVYMLRNPVDRAWSHALQHLVRRLRRDPAKITPERVLAYLRRAEGWRLSGCYLTNLERWQRRFPSEQILVTFFDDVACQPEVLLTSIFDHIGAPRPDDWSAFPARTRINRTPDAHIPEPVREYLMSLYRDDLEQLAERFGAPAQRWIAC